MTDSNEGAARQDLILRIAGEGGEGIISTGDFIAAACARDGLEVYTFKTFPAEIRGGYAMFQVRTGTAPIHCQGDGFDVLCAFNGEAFALNRDALRPGQALVYDAPGDFDPDIPEGVFAYPIPMSAVAAELRAPRAKNMVALGALSVLFGLNAETLIEVLSDKFAAKGEAVLATNLEAFAQGQAAARELGKQDPWRIGEAAARRDVIVISGNDGVGLGAILGGLEFFSAYPITPATEIARYVATHLPKTGGTLVQAEDEIASIAQVLGASYAGRRAMTATSGPGLSLMSELLGMASMGEIPTLVVDVQRGGPATGMPTKHEQSDLFLAVYGTHGDAPRIVLAAEHVGDCIELAARGLALAEHYQCPVILLSDGSLAFSTQTIPRPRPEAFERAERRRWDGVGTYERYAAAPDFISAMVDPGTPDGMHIATGLEHDAKGAPNVSPLNRERMQHKRFAKLNGVVAEMAPIEVDGEGPAVLGIIAWGSTIGAVREAIARLRGEGIAVKGLYPKLLWPMPVAEYEAFGADCDQLLVPEVNHQGQLAHLIRAETGLRPHSLTRSGGLPFTPAAILDHAKEILNGGDSASPAGHAAAASGL